MNIFSLSPFAPENLVSRDESGRPVLLRQPPHTLIITTLIFTLIFIFTLIVIFTLIFIFILNSSFSTLRLNLVLNGFPNVSRIVENIEEKPTVIIYTCYINRHAETTKQSQKGQHTISKKV